ncbi:MAG: hypothetical protein H8E86_08810, partial [Planctomycetes bacterium]|nr:hypothetical protein [Planctomycetota bacterium]
MTYSLLKDQQKQIAAIEALIRETYDAQENLKKSVSEKREQTKNEHAKTLDECESTATENREKTRLKKDFDLEQLVKRRSLEPELLLERHEQSIIEINMRAKEIKETTESKLNEATWLAESVFEGAISMPREEAKEAHEALLSLQEELDALCEEAPKALSRMRQSEILESNAKENEAKKPMEYYVSGAADALKAIQTDQRALWFIGLRPLYIVLFVTAVAVFAAGAYTGWEKTLAFFSIPAIAMLVAIGALALTYVSGQNSIQKRIVQFSQCVSKAKLSYATSGKVIDNKRKEQEIGVTANRDSEIKKAEEKYLPKLEEIERLHKKDLDKEKKRFRNVEEKLSGNIEEDAKEVEQSYETSMQNIDQDETTTKDKAGKTCASSLASIDGIEKETMHQLTSTWDEKMREFQIEIAKQKETMQKNHPAWSSAWGNWKPRLDSTLHIPVGTFSINLETIGGTLPPSDLFSLHGDALLDAAFASTLPNDASILISSTRKTRTEAIGLLQNAMIRSLTALPAGKAKFTLIDPVGLGQSFAGVLHLADYEESQLLDRAWTEPRHIETQLARLTEHMETVIQKYLRNDFESIDAYNEQAGEIAEPYRFLVIADLPNNFSETAVERLSRIITIRLTP